MEQRRCFLLLYSFCVSKLFDFSPLLAGFLLTVPRHAGSWTFEDGFSGNRGQDGLRSHERGRGVFNEKALNEG